MRMKKVQILMSTYNGQTYLRKQIESILRQTYQNIELVIRDDGSKDETVSILREYEQQFKNIRVIYGKNVGVNSSFFLLLEQCNADYIAFADQDDIWLPEKIQSAVEKLDKYNVPAVYACNKILIDGNDYITKKNNNRDIKPSFSNALVENICTGCTIVMNKKIADDLKLHIPRQAILHDWWCYLVASYLGVVVYDKNAFILYRQHGENVVGATENILKKIEFNVKYILKNRGKLGKQLEEFQNIYHIFPEKDRQLQKLKEAENFPGSIKIVFDKNIKRQSIADDIIMRILFICKLML